MARPDARSSDSYPNNASAAAASERATVQMPAEPVYGSATAVLANFASAEDLSSRWTHSSSFLPRTTALNSSGVLSFSSLTTAVTDATFPLAGTYVLKLTANDSQLASSATTTITVNAAPLAISLTPTMAGPNVTATTQTMTATVTQAGIAVSGAAVQFTVTGANATSGSATTNSSGVATFSYNGPKQGTDTVQATSSGALSNTATITWITPVKIISTTTVLGRFFPGG